MVHLNIENWIRTEETAPLGFHCLRIKNENFAGNNSCWRMKERKQIKLKDKCAQKTKSAKSGPS